MSDDPTERDVEALTGILRHGMKPSSDKAGTFASVARRVLTSDWYAERIAQAEQRGREDNADHGMCYVSGSKALAAREAQARREALDEVSEIAVDLCTCEARPQNGPHGYMCPTRRLRKRLHRAAVLRGDDA